MNETRLSSDISAQKSLDFVHVLVVTVKMEDKSAEAVSHRSSALMATPGWWRWDAPAASGQELDGAEEKPELQQPHIPDDPRQEFCLTLGIS